MKDQLAKDHGMTTPMTLQDVQASIDNARRQGRPILLNGANLEGLSLQGINLAGAWLQGARLTKVNLQGACLRGAYLQYADLRGANLQDADLQQANLHTANLSTAKLQRANLQNAQLGDANMTHVDLHGANMRDTYLGIPGIDRVDLRLARRSHGTIAALRDRLWNMLGITRRQHLRPAPVPVGAKIVS